MTFFIYNLLFIPLLLVLLPSYLIRMVRRGGYRRKAAQRFCHFDKETLERIGTGRIWIHASSVGETGIALKFVKEYEARHPETRFLLSITTSTGLAIAERQASESVEVIANPVDFPILTARLLKKIRPSALLFVEADLWPNRVSAARKLGIPVVLLNARLSDRSARRFRKARFLTAPLFRSLTAILITEPTDKKRWEELGVPAEMLHLTGNIKYDNSLASKIPPLELPQELGWLQSDPLFLAASTHEGEEEEVVRAYLAARQTIPLLRLAIAPRHVERSTSILGKLASLGLKATLRSRPESTPSDLLLIDTTGELSRWYPLARVVFVGKSLPCSVNHGGQNMIEPLQSGTPVLIGQHTANFEPLATMLCNAGAILRVNNSPEIAAALSRLVENETVRHSMLRAATDILEPHRGATERTCALVGELIGS